MKIKIAEYFYYLKGLYDRLKISKQLITYPYKSLTRAGDL